MIEVERSSMAALREAQKVGNSVDTDIILIDLLTDTEMHFRGTASTYHHLDAQALTKLDYDLMVKIAGYQSWRARPALIKIRGRVFAVSYHSFYHSVAVATGAYNPSGRTMKRGMGATPEFEKTLENKWRIGTHICIHTEDTIAIRKASDNWYIEMRAAVLNAESMAKVIPITPHIPPAAVVSYYVMVSTKNLPLNVRSEPSTAKGALSVIGTLPIGSVHLIVKESTGIGAKLWGQLESGGWISLDLTVPIDAPVSTFKSYDVIITANPSLRIRSGAGVTYGQTGSIVKGGTATIVAEAIGHVDSKGTNGRWGQNPDGGWFALEYTKIA